MDMSKSQRHTRSGAGRGVSQANEAAISPKFTGLCQHEIFSGILKKWKQCGTVQASYGCQIGHVNMGICISVFAPQLCNTSISGLDEYADGCLFKNGAGWYPFCPGGGTGRGGVGGGGHPKDYACLPKQTPARKQNQYIYPSWRDASANRIIVTRHILAALNSIKRFLFRPAIPSHEFDPKKNLTIVPPVIV